MFVIHNVDIRKTANVVYGTTIAVALPVLADVKRLKWRGVICPWTSQAA